MATHKITTPLVYYPAAKQQEGFLAKYNAFVDAQKPNSIAWWLGSLMLHGCVLVPLTFLLVYSLNGPSLPFLFISMIAFFINVIANMGGAPFRFTFGTFVLSLVLHAGMVLSTVLLYA